MTMKKTASDLETRTRKMRNSHVPQARCARVLGAALTLATLSMSALCVLEGTPAAAQHGPVQRTVDGVVQNSAGGSVKGAVVYLKDTKSLSVKSFVSTDAGTFHFSQLSPDTDYDVWAELQGKKSKTRSISQFNSKTQFTYTLKIED